MYVQGELFLSVGWYNRYNHRPKLPDNNLQNNNTTTQSRATKFQATMSSGSNLDGVRQWVEGAVFRLSCPLTLTQHTKG